MSKRLIKKENDKKMIRNLIRIIYSFSLASTFARNSQITLNVFPVFAWSRWREPIDVCWRIKFATSSNSLLSTSPSPFKSNILKAISKWRRDAEKQIEQNWTNLCNEFLFKLHELDVKSFIQFGVVIYRKQLPSMQPVISRKSATEILYFVQHFIINPVEL